MGATFASASPQEAKSVGAVEAEQASAQGDIRFGGRPLVIEDFDTRGTTPPAGPFELSAKAIHSRVAVVESVVLAGSYGHEKDAYVERKEFTNAMARSDGPRPGHYLAIFGSPTSQFELSASRGTVQPAPETTFRSTEFAYSEIQPLERDLTDAITWTQPGAAGMLTLRGDFTVVLWETDLDVADSEGETTIWTGIRDHPIVPGPADVPTAAIADRTKRQAYLEVEGGTLTMPWLAASMKLHLLSGDMVVEGEVTFEGPTGTLVSAVPSEDTLTLQGDLHLTLANADSGRIPFEIRGNLREAESGGDAIALVIPGSPEILGLRPWLWLVGAAVVALPAIFIAGVYTRRRQQSARMERMETLMEAGEFEAAARAADRLLRSKDFGKDASVIKVEALVRLGRYDEAGQFLDSLKPWTGAPAAMIDFLNSYVLVLRGFTDKAVTRLAACLEAAPEFVDEVQASAAFAPILDDPRLAQYFSAKNRDGWSLGAYT